MKQITPRERIMVAALPAGILLLVYFFFFARPDGKELQDLRRRVGVAEGQVPPAQVQAETSSELVRLEAEVGQKREAARERRERNEAIQEFWEDPDARARSGEFIGNLLASNGVVLVEEAVASDEDSQQFADLLKPLPSAELWRLRLAGSYDAMRRTISAIGKTNLPIVPAGIEMEAKVEGNKTIHLWNLWICR
ncbi:MAG: hypothetical protein AAF236_06720 [Verrucomicrobiota bacterium]